jgi:hypothetical protein
MIGVIANAAEHRAVQEFFELFKTPWEFYRPERYYEVLVCADGSSVQNGSAQLILIYAGRQLSFDAEHLRVNSRHSGTRMLLGEGARIPIYGDSVTFASGGTCFLVEEDSHQNVAYLAREKNRSTVVRVGYDIFREITTLLCDGQPCANAGIPALDLHISLLRNLIVDCEIPLVEIPPVPQGYRFIACLTHDVDHPLIRQHKFDRTMFGFLYRVIVGSLTGALRRRLGLRILLTNWAAALKLPFVYLGLAKDFWSQLTAYTALEGEATSSFFVIPFKGRPGAKDGRQAPSLRATRYGASDIATELRQLLSRGHEIGLHGIDAWHDSSKGREEIAEIRRVTGVQEIGVRMHWLYFDKKSTSVLESLGADYDSTVGYNDGVGYRAGTVQVYKPLETTRLLELPLHIMDTALFSDQRQRLSALEARKLVQAIIDNAVRLGGVITINWHDRSIAPERLWQDFYVTLLCELKRQGAWLANARDTVGWFRKRRLATFAGDDSISGVTAVNARNHTGENQPNLCMRLHNVYGRAYAESQLGDESETLNIQQS